MHPTHSLPLRSAQGKAQCRQRVRVVVYNQIQPPGIFLPSGRIHTRPLRVSHSLRSGTVTQAVETVEKVTFQELFLKSGRETPKSAWFLVFRTTFWRFLSLKWEIFVRFFQTKGFSTVSLGCQHFRP
jgi:hypothetical protein